MRFRWIPAIASALALIPTGSAQTGTTRKKNTTRTQSIHVGEPSTTHPGGNPGRSTSRTTNNSPFGNTAPAAAKPVQQKPDKPLVRACPQDPNRQTGVPDVIGTWKVEASQIGPITLRNTSAAPDSFADHIACDLDRMYKTRAGKLLFQNLESELARIRRTRAHDAFVHIEYRADSGGGPSTSPAGLAMKWIFAQDRTLGEVFGDMPRRPRKSNGETDWTSPAERPQPLPGPVVWAGSKFRGMGVGSTIFFDPDAFPLARWGSDTPAHVALFHELIHALRHAQGRADRTPIPDATDPSKVDPTWLIREERDVIDGNFLVTENAYRKEVGLSSRDCVAPTCF